MRHGIGCDAFCLTLKSFNYGNKVLQMHRVWQRNRETD